MASIDTIWDTIDLEATSRLQTPPQRLQSRRSSTPSPSKFSGLVKKSDSEAIPRWKKNAETAKNAINDFISALNADSRLGVQVALVGNEKTILNDLPIFTEPTLYRRSGDHLFAFIVGDSGFLIINSDVSGKISDWASSYKESIRPKPDRGVPLVGF